LSQRQEQELLRELAWIAHQMTGFRPDAVSQEALGRFLDQERRVGRNAADLLSSLRHGEPASAQRLVAQVLVAETFFFRHPEQFEILSDVVLPELSAHGRPPRLWSAGCASGEEAYSLAACVLDSGHPRAADAEVLGTDLSGPRLEIARQGLFGRWSVREAAPLLYPLLEPEGEKLRVRGPVRGVTRFQLHNLLEPPPAPGLFDVVFCRNVLVYLDDEPARTVRRHLASAVRPGGYLFLGPLEGGEPPPGFSPALGSRPDVLRRSGAAAEAAESPPPAADEPRPLPPLEAAPPLMGPAPGAMAAPAAPATPEGARGPAAPSPEVAAHCRALHLVERGELTLARSVLADLRRRAPCYLPAAVDLALVQSRLGHGAAARALMREALALAGALCPTQAVDGPQPLPAEYYRAVAQAFLTQRRPVQ
jgi:chemotaxis methyl-accepting protein methylase